MTCLHVGMNGLGATDRLGKLESAKRGTNTLLIFFFYGIAVVENNNI